MTPPPDVPVALRRLLVQPAHVTVTVHVRVRVVTHELKGLEAEGERGVVDRVEVDRVLSYAPGKGIVMIKYPIIESQEDKTCF